jgi:hypothetical protein
VSLHWYAITTSSPEIDPLQLRGIGGAALRWLEGAGLNALVSSASPEHTVQAALEHHAVVAGVHAVVPTLPVRFAAPIKADAIAEHLRVHEDQYRERLARVGGALEFGVRIAFVEPFKPTSTPHASSGAAFLRARGEALRLEAVRAEQLQGIAAQLEAALLERTLEVRGGFSAELYRASYLVLRDDLRHFERFRSCLPSFDGVHVSWHGPFPPYSFTSAGAPAGGSS